MQDNQTQSDTTFSLSNLSFRVPGRTLLHPLCLL
ncbi:Fe3+-hydroxamate ABC transporter ATP-binding protein FhuC, partial [Escherichia coli]|nr:Fe3+-hydroxamate ABC transporter ATP-binding protein FhuC [Escherichia coli]